MEVNDQQLAGLVAAQRILQSLWGTPEGQALVTKHAGASGVSPEAQLAENTAARVRAEIDAKLKPIQDAEAARAKADAERDAERSKRAAEALDKETKDRFRLTAKGLEAVHQFMAERKIADPRDAAELMFARAMPEIMAPTQEPLVQPESPATKAHRELLKNDPLAWAREEFTAGLAEIEKHAEAEAA